MRKSEAGDVPDDDDADLDVPGVFLREDGVVDPAVDGAEQVPASVERVAREIRQGLTLEEEERQVVGRDVDRGDGDQRVDKSARQLLRRQAAANGACTLDAQAVEGGDERDA